MAEPAPGNHRHIDAAGREDRREHQGDVVADAASRVLVRNGSVEIGPVEDGPGIAHGQGERHTLVHAHVAEIDRHSESRCLSMRDRTLGEAGDETRDFLAGEGLAVALTDDDFLRKKGHARPYVSSKRQKTAGVIRADDPRPWLPASGCDAANRVYWPTDGA